MDDITIDEAEKEASEVLSLLSCKRVNAHNKSETKVVTDDERKESDWDAQVEIVVKTDPSERNKSSHKENGSPQGPANEMLSVPIRLDDTFSLVVTDEKGKDSDWDAQVEIVVKTDTSEINETCQKENDFPQGPGEATSEPKTNGAEGNTGNSQKRRKPTVRKYGRPAAGEDGCGTWRLETSPHEVRRRFEQGCECSDDSCFRGLNPDSVYKHRLNIAELTKEEHDMYLMGVIMACMADPEATLRRRARTRLRAQYAYAGRRVCLQAFLYLENVTLYQLKRIRKHVVTHGVTPRIHGNHGKKPHNVFSLDTYRRATFFLKNFIQDYTPPGSSAKAAVQLPPDITRKAIHDLYREYVGQEAPSNEKAMGYSTFRHFIKEQFPNLRFTKVDGFCGVYSTNKGTERKAPQPPLATIEEKSAPGTSEVTALDVASLPIIFAESSSEKQAAYLVPLSHFKPMSLVATNTSGDHTEYSFAI